MNENQCGISCCQRCQFYTLEGRRGGHCSQLDVPVQGKWSPCPLASPVFSEPIQTITKLPVWSDALVLAHRDAVIATKECLTR